MWRQWAALGSMASASRRAQSIVDPEALLLLSFILTPYHRRLVDEIHWWAAAGSGVTSVQRIRNLARTFGPSELIERGLAAFARAALELGRDARWRSLASGAGALAPRRHEHLMSDLQFIEPPALMVRLRVGFGVGSKSDLLCFLLGSHGSSASVRDIARATGYTRKAIQNSAGDMSKARFLEALDDHPAAYRAEPAPWRELLGWKSLPNWKHWAPLYRFVAAVSLRFDGRQELPRSPYVLASRMRDLYVEHREAFRWNRIPHPAPERSRGEAYSEAFRGLLVQTAGWLEENA
ncbi:MAG: hypothetical protein HY720_22260 [Planctomycetes bacterium]|nr:hypothetical protein [Planctomycetota bacterium]